MRPAATAVAAAVAARAQLPGTGVPRRMANIYDISYMIVAKSGPGTGARVQPVDFYKCLADATRLRCLLLIHEEQELCVCELTAALGEIQPKVSRHLAQLRKCGLLADRRQGQWVFYRIAPQLPAWARAVLAETARANAAFVRPNLKNLERMGSRPARQRDCCGVSA